MMQDLLIDVANIDHGADMTRFGLSLCPFLSPVTSHTQAASPQPVHDDALADSRVDAHCSDAAEPPFNPLDFDAGIDASLADPAEAKPWPTPDPRYPNCLYVTDVSP